MSKQIGSVEIKRPRVYPYDWRNPSAGDATVEPGTFPLYRDGDRVWWEMRGRRSVYVPGTSHPLGEGLFGISPGGDDRYGVVVKVFSREFTPEQLADLMSDPTCQEGPEQRLAIKLFEPLEAVAS